MRKLVLIAILFGAGLIVQAQDVWDVEAQARAAAAQAAQAQQQAAQAQQMVNELAEERIRERNAQAEAAARREQEYEQKMAQIAEAQRLQHAEAAQWVSQQTAELNKKTAEINAQIAEMDAQDAKEVLTPLEITRLVAVIPYMPEMQDYLRRHLVTPEQVAASENYLRQHPMPATSGPELDAWTAAAETYFRVGAAPQSWKDVENMPGYQSEDPLRKLVTFARWHDQAYNYVTQLPDWRQNASEFNKKAADKERELGLAARAIFPDGHFFKSPMSADEARYRIAQQILAADPNATLEPDLKALYEKGPPPGIVESQPK